jgi:hypothetical protein
MAENDLPLKAFAVTEEYESTGAIIFAKHAVTARRLGANEYADGEFSSVSCRRSPWADDCAETGIVPVSLMVEHGWHFECTGCGQRIDTDLAYLYEWEGDEPETADRAQRYKGWKPDHIIGHQHSQVFCNQACKETHEAHEAERKRRQERAIERFKAAILRRFPDASFVNDSDRYRSSPHAYAYKKDGRWRIGQVRVPFSYPGAKYGPAELVYDRDAAWRGEQHPHYTCAGGDKGAFEAYSRARPSPSPSPKNIAAQEVER